MLRLCFAALAAAILLLVSNVPLVAATSVDDEGCVDGGARWDYQLVHRIVVWEDNNVSYMEEVPCGSGNWYERHKVSAAPPTTLKNPGVFTSSGTVEFYQAAATSGIITAGTGPDSRGFTSAPSTLKLVISAPVVQSLMTTLH